MKIAVVTGASRGIGQGFVEVLQQRGYLVYAGVRSTAGHEDSEQVHYVQLDVTDDVSITAAVQTVQKEHGHVDLLINNAGINHAHAADGRVDKAARLATLERGMLQEMCNVNSIGPVMVAKQFVPLMTKPDSFIINISSDRASFHDDTNTTGNYGYRASKAALNMLTQCLVYDLPKNVSVFAVHPGWVLTDMNPRGVITPKESATLILDILKKWKPELNGSYLKNDGTPHPL